MKGLTAASSNLRNVSTAATTTFLPAATSLFRGRSFYVVSGIVLVSGALAIYFLAKHYLKKTDDAGKPPLPDNKNNPLDDQPKVEIDPLKEKAAITIQSHYRAYRARKKIIKQIEVNKSLEIVDLKVAPGYGVEEVQAIKKIEDAELVKEDALLLKVATQCILISNLPESIFLAKIKNEVVGFLVTQKYEEFGDNPKYTEHNTSMVVGVAVDSSVKRSGVGTRLMLATMKKTKELGKDYLMVYYVSGRHQGIDKKKCAMKNQFFMHNSKFMPPEYINRKTTINRVSHTFIYFDLSQYGPQAEADKIGEKSINE